MSADIYSVKPTPHPGTYTFTKFDNDLNPITSYLVSQGECNCPRGEQGKACRHREMLHTFKSKGHIGDGWFFNRSTHQWIRPPSAIAEAVIEAAASHDSVAPQDPPPEPQVLASAPLSAGSNGGGSAPSGIRKRRI